MNQSRTDVPSVSEKLRGHNDRAPGLGYNRRMHAWAVLSAVAALFLIAAGAAVTSTGSGDAVPDWPLSFGSLSPPMVGGVFYEHGHRLVAGLVALIIAIQAIWLRSADPRRWLRTLGWTTLILMLLQALLGGLRVLVVSDETVQEVALRLSGAGHVQPVRIVVGIAHAALAHIVVALSFVIALATSRAWLGAARPDSNAPPTRATHRLALFWRRKPNSRNVATKPADGSAADGPMPHPSPMPHPFHGVCAPAMASPYGLVLVAAGAIFVQLLLGAVSRHAGAGLSIPDFPLSFGRIIPPFHDLPFDPGGPMTYGEFAFKVGVAFTHRVLAFVIAGLLIVALTRFIRANGRRTATCCLLAYAPAGLVLAQLALGAFAVWTDRMVVVTVLHVTVAAALLGFSTAYIVWQRKIADCRLTPPPEPVAD